MIDQPEYRDLFVSEAQEFLRHMDVGAMALENDPKDSEAIAGLFRAAHTLKGMAATMGFDGITRLCHEYESALDLVRSGTMAVTPALVEVLFAGTDELLKLVGQVAAGNMAQESDPALLARVKALVAGVPATAGAFATAPRSQGGATATVSRDTWPVDSVSKNRVIQALGEGGDVFKLDVDIDLACAFKGVRAYLVLKAVEKFGKVLATEPEGKRLEEGAFPQTATFWVASSAPAEELRLAASKVMEVTAARIVAVLPDLAEAPAEVLATPVASQPEAVETTAQAPAVAVKQTLRVQVERLDKIMNMVGELVTYKIRLAQIAKERHLKELNDALVQVEHVVNELQAEVMAARMVPMDHVFSRFPRMVRDLAKDLGKQIELELHGRDIELDRSILDEIADPLVHLVRNSCDHGVETVTERLAAGKPALAKLKLTAVRERNQVVITVEDDGHGIRVDKVREVALRRGLLKPEEARGLSDEEAVNLIFMPGFSTASKVTEISGRGVGLDAVRSKLESLGGTLRVESFPGNGSRFKLRLPLTMAILKAMRIRLGAEEYMVPVVNVIEAVEFNAPELRRAHGQEVVMLRDELVPVLRLGALLEVPGSLSADPANGLPYFTVLVVDTGERRVGLMVDEVLGQQEVALKTLGRSLKTVRGFGGVTILGDGAVCLILDVASLLES